MKKILFISLCVASSYAVENELHNLSQSLNALAQKLSEKKLPQQPSIGAQLAPLGNLDTYKVNDITIHLIEGDITKLKSQQGIVVDAIVNAANKELARGSGVCGAIFKAAEAGGEDRLTREIKRRYPHGIEPGQAAATLSHGLMASEEVNDIIHAVGPIYKNYKDKKEAARILASAYFQSMILAKAFGLSSIAFPFISSAIYGYPKPEAAKIALESIIKFSEKFKSSITDVYFVLYGASDLDIFKAELAKIINA